MNYKFSLIILISTLLLSGCFLSKKGSKTASSKEDPYSSIIYVTDPKQDSIAKARAAQQHKRELLFHEDSLLKAKYARNMQIPPDSIRDVSLPLYRFIDNWIYTPYLWGGTTRKGIDCSAFVQRLLAEVYDVEVPRTSIQQYLTRNVIPFRGLDRLEEGDLIFFKTIDGNPITHVGLYLKNGYFINSASKGVTIANLRSAYWASKYVSCGRINLAKSTRIRNVSKN
ncbi:hypothetical protein A8C56_16645 [Niabella ginsenosidivorans]|uniref:NlpC/P60 domain-containing protein n=1 Tax=Niabella ginsenosidivorans TaxID=1176587 RepID=A0A1A9I4X7_9BACT|nr:C40 family peptidase [Niabella ginsenosidivorans]ANH82375.1 hypothetical protein A8C56_16645 [Niabella ginsenosidivorans]